MKSDTVHKQIVEKLKARAGTANTGQSSDSYTGSRHTFYAVSVPNRRAILKDVIREHKRDATNEEWLSLINALIAGESHEEKTMGAYLLNYLPKVRKAAGFSHLNDWLSKLNGWAEIDSLCQNVFQPGEILENLKDWHAFLVTLSKDKNINKRRASLVFLTGPTWKSDDKDLHDLAYKNIERLKGETDILITKAISWLLRSMAGTRPKVVAAYIVANETLLPRIAVRETKHKLKTGKKNK